MSGKIIPRPIYSSPRRIANSSENSVMVAMSPGNSGVLFSPDPIPLDSKGRPIVKDILKRAEKEQRSSPINVNKVSLTPKPNFSNNRNVPSSSGAASRAGKIPEQRKVVTAYVNNGLSNRVVEMSKSKSEIQKRNQEDLFRDLPEFEVPDVQLKFPEFRENPALNALSQRLNQELAHMEQIPSGYVQYKTSGGIYQVPDYEKWTALEREHEKIHLRGTIKDMNEKWNKHGMVFEMPDYDEHIITTNIRIQNYVKRIKRRNGTNFWWFVLAGVWGFVEYGLTWLGFKARGLMISQLQQFRVYESQMIEMGQVSTVGHDWPPWLQMAVTTAMSSAVFVGLATIGGKKGTKHAGTATKLISRIISGDKSAVQFDENGRPLAPEEDFLDKTSKVLDNIEGGSVFDIFSAISGLMGGGEEEESEKEKKKKKKKKESKPEKSSKVEEKEMTKEEKREALRKKKEARQNS